MSLRLSPFATTANQKNVMAVGTAAKRMLGRTPGNITAMRPLKDGVIADFEVTEQMLQHFIRKVHDRGILFPPSPRVLVCVPCKSTLVEQRAIRASDGAGAREVRLIEEPMAAAIGAGLPVEQACGSMVVDIGGGTTEIAVIIALNGIVYSATRSENRRRSVSTNASCPMCVATHGSLIGESTAERIKQEIGSAFPADEIREIEVRGRNLAEGVPRSFTVNSDEVYEAIHDTLEGIVSAVKSALEQTPAELSADISERGMVLTGGGALLRDMDKLLSRETGLPVFAAEDPLTCVARGGGRALAFLDDPAYEMLGVKKASNHAHLRHVNSAGSTPSFLASHPLVAGFCR
jgi:rod shape-determining protein MreB